VSWETWWQTIVQINTQVNQSITYSREAGADKWRVVSMPGHGDCEDYALTKLQLLADAGISPEALGLAVGKIGAGPVRGIHDIDHAWAVVFTDKGMFHLDQSPNVPL
jgi:predicted transglutaminase-like cysteine proteinase